jgi:hypothetical protein
MDPRFIKLPILLPGDAPRRSSAERYGALFYLGVAGLVLTLGMVAWFGWGVWSLRDVWANIYAVNDPRRPEAERVRAAEALVRDSRVAPRQLWDLALSRVPPARARYLFAEALRGEAVEGDPRGYALAVARSEGWPDWLRLLLTRPLAYGAEVHPLPRAPLDELRRQQDPAIRLWALYALAVAVEDRDAAAALDAEAARDGSMSDLARLLSDARRAPPGSAKRRAQLDDATRWLRANHPEARTVWSD